MKFVGVTTSGIALFLVLGLGKFQTAVEAVCNRATCTAPGCVVPAEASDACPNSYLCYQDACADCCARATCQASGTNECTPAGCRLPIGTACPDGTDCATDTDCHYGCCIPRTATPAPLTCTTEQRATCAAAGCVLPAATTGECPDHAGCYLVESCRGCCARKSCPNKVGTPPVDHACPLLCRNHATCPAGTDCTNAACNFGCCVPISALSTTPSPSTSGAVSKLVGGLFALWIGVFIALSV